MAVFSPTKYNLEGTVDVIFTPSENYSNKVVNNIENLDHIAINTSLLIPLGAEIMNGCQYSAILDTIISDLTSEEFNKLKKYAI